MGVFQAVRALEKEVKRLNPHQGRIARRNARRAILGALRHVRNELNAEFPRIEKIISEDDPQFLVECFEKAHTSWVKIGGKLGQRQIADRWIVAREHFVTTGFPKGYYTGGTMRSMSLQKATKVVRRLKTKMPTHTWRLRQVKTDTIIMADIL